MSKKGVSAEEKKNRMLELFYERGEFFQLKELEKIAPRDKGVVSNSVKDVVQILVEDGLVETDKIGTSVYFWAFPSQAVNIRKRKLKEIETKQEENHKKLKMIEKTVEDTKTSEDSEQKLAAILSEINELELELETAKKLLKDHKENDPTMFDEMAKKTEALKDAANRWTDNIFSIKSYCKKKFFMEDKVINKQFGIPADFDYIE